MPSDQSTDELIAGIRDPGTRRTAHNAAYVLNMTQQMPEPSREDVRQIRMAQALHDADNGGGYPPPAPGLNTNIPDNSGKSELVTCHRLFHEHHLTPVSRLLHTTEYNQPRCS